MLCGVRVSETGGMQLYWLPCPVCYTSSLIEVDGLGRAGIACHQHGLLLIPRRAPTEAEREGKVRGVYAKARRRFAATLGVMFPGETQGRGGEEVGEQ